MLHKKSSDGGYSRARSCSGGTGVEIAMGSAGGKGPAGAATQAAANAIAPDPAQDRMRARRDAGCPRLVVIEAHRSYWR